MSFEAPSASAISWRARSAHTRVTDVGEDDRLGRHAATPPRRAGSTVSFVLMHPSESIRSNVSGSGLSQGLVGLVQVDDRVGRDHDEHRRQGGRQHARALGHAAHREAVDRDGRGLRHRVGGPDGLGGIRARHRPTAPAAARRCRRGRCGIGRRSPIRPVEQTPTSPAPMSIPCPARTVATCSAVWWVSPKPPGPVHAFAPPELRTTALIWPSRHDLLRPQHRRGLEPIAREHRRGDVEGPSFTTRARSGLPEALMPAPYSAGPKALWRLVTVTVRLHSSTGPTPRRGRG